MHDAIWVNSNLATIASPGTYGLVQDGAIAVTERKIAWVGTLSELGKDPARIAKTVHDMHGYLITPGFVDSHTHIVYHSEGLTDFEILARSGTREELMRAGGGVRGMVRRTRQATEEQLFASTARRCWRLIASGVTTVESKSGAGLDLETELRMMRVSRRLGKELPLTVISTFLGAHGVAPEYDGRSDEYIRFLCEQVLPAAVREGLVDAVDGFCDKVGFSHAQIDRLFEKAKSFGLPVRLHADQYSDFGAGAVVAKWHGTTADHLEYASEETARAMGEAGVVATLLPGAHWTLHETHRPPVKLFRQHRVDMALATNSNPVSSPTTSPTMMMNMACHLFGLSPEEALTGFTRNGAKALGLLASRGTLEVGKVADFAIWDVEHPAELSYYIGSNPCVSVVKNGTVVYEAHRMGGQI
jgi:imidazolonepropionase